jgi:hypothetical protein
MILATSVLIAQPESNVPSNMSFQGLLTDTEGIAYDDGEYQLTFRLIREMNDGTEQTVWEESHLINVTNGVFSVVLGSENPLPLNISPNVLLETQVGDEILSPRQPLTSVPFALKSSRSQQAYQSVLSDTANFAYNAQNATHADTAHFLLNMPMVDSVMFAEQAHHSMYADTAQFVALAQSALTSSTSENATNAVYADTAFFVDLSQYNGNVNIDGTVTANSFIPFGVGDKFIEITLEGVYGAGNVEFDLDAALGSNNTWYVLEALTVTEWDGNTTSWFNIELNVSDEQENTGGVTIDYQSNRVRPRFYSSDLAIYTYSSNGQHSLTLNCQGRSSTIKVLFRVTSDWSN